MVIPTAAAPAAYLPLVSPYPFPARMPYPAVLYPTLPHHMQGIQAFVSLSMYALLPCPALAATCPTTPYAAYLCACVATYSAAIWAQTTERLPLHPFWRLDGSGVQCSTFS